MNAQVVIPGKFWIVTDKYGKVGTLRACDDGFEFYDERLKSKKIIDDIESFEQSSEIEQHEGEELVNGFPSKGIPYPSEHPELPVYRKTANGKAVYAAGYYIVQFSGMGWQRAFSPKLDTLEKYPYKGPYRTEWEMNMELNRHKKSQSNINV